MRNGNNNTWCSVAFGPARGRRRDRDLKDDQNTKRRFGPRVPWSSSTSSSGYASRWSLGSHVLCSLP